MPYFPHQGDIIYMRFSLGEARSKSLENAE
jgi:hypothetical protein